MRIILTIAILAFLVVFASSAPVLADDDESDDKEQEGQNEDNEKENRLPGFEVALAFACCLGATRLLRKAS